MAGVILDAGPEQYGYFFPILDKHRTDAIRLLSGRLRRPVPDSLTLAERQRELKQQALAAVTLYRLGEVAAVWPLLRHKPDNTVRSYLVHQLGRLDASPLPILQRLEEETDVTVLRTLVLSLGEFDASRMPIEQRAHVTALLRPQSNRRVDRAIGDCPLLPRLRVVTILGAQFEIGEQMSFSVCLLTFGQHLILAKRCLDSILNRAHWPWIIDVRIGFNAVTPDTIAIAKEFSRRVPVPVFGFLPDGNVGKYPLMRRMFHGAEVPMSADLIMWFDDDSYLTDCESSPYDWWARLLELSRKANLIGSAYRLEPKAYERFLRQWPGIQVQPWFTGKPPARCEDFYFVTGGWWVAATSLLKRFDYPFVEIHHNGGDALLGEVCRQHDMTLASFRRGVAINADEQGRESGAPSRGLTSRWPFEDYTNGGPITFRDACRLKYHQFDCRVERL